MYRKPLSRSFPLSLLIITAALALTGCGLLFKPVTVDGTAPTPVVSVEQGGVENPDVYVDAALFQPALIEALAARDTQKLQMWMTDPFLSGAWRGDYADASPAQALQALSAEPLNAETALSAVQDADLQELMGGKDPLSISPGSTDAFLVSGWGKDGRDEALIFLARQPDNSLKWRGYVVVKGGFSGARLGGVQSYRNDHLGYSLFAPASYQISVPDEKTISIIAPQGNGGHPGYAYIAVEPAGGRTLEQVFQQVIEDNKIILNPGWNPPAPVELDIDGVQALVLEGLPGQDVNRQLFMVHNDRYYFMMFAPADVQSGEAHWQMEDAYAMVINTFHFTR